MQSTPTLLAAFRTVPLLHELTDEQLQGIAQGTELWKEPGEHFAAQDDAQAYFHVLFAGTVEWTRRLGQQDVHILTHESGMYFGHEPILLDIPVPVTGTALTPCHAFRFDVDAFWRMLAICPSILRELLQTVTQRFQTLESVSQQHAKLLSLGTMAAGLAHELNNPASAAQRGAGQVREQIAALPSLALQLSQACLSAAQTDTLVDRICAAVAHVVDSSALSPLEQSDREDELAGWLDDYGVDDGWELAPTFVSAGLNTAWLDDLAQDLPSPAVVPVVRYLKATLAATAEAHEVESSAARISALVDALRSYTYLDRAPEQEIDINQGLDDTLAMLNARLGRTTVTRHYDQHLPRITAYGAELNQVWTNLIYNALDAVGNNGHITISTTCENDRVLVAITDNGPGIPPAIQGRIWEPFFTTKAVGAGTGLGLDVAYRIVVGRHGGDIRVVSQPGSTVFEVRLPLTQG